MARARGMARAGARRMRMQLVPLGVVAMASLVGACATDDAESPDDEWGMSGPLSPTPPIGKEDSELRRGLLVATDTSRTQVWMARNRWEDTTTAAARAAGLAWTADSGL